MRHLSSSAVPAAARVLLLATAAVLVLTTSCTDGDGPGPTGPLTPVNLLLRPTLASTAAAAADAPPVNLIRATVEDARTGAVLATVDTVVDPEAEAWTVRVEFEIEGRSASVRVLLELLNGVEGVETPVWSGEVGPIEVAQGEQTEVPSEDVDLFRGPPANLSVTSVAIRADTSRIVEGDELALDADVVTEGDGQQPLVFWTSLDDEVATVDDQGVVSAILPGAAPIVAEAGPHADTLEVTVLALPVRIVVSPDTVVVEELGTTVGFTASVEDERGEPVERAEVEWSVDDPTRAESLGGGEFTALATGETDVLAALVSDPDVVGVAVLIIETGPQILRPVEGDGQEAEVNTPVPIPPAVQVLDASERPLEGVEVLFEVTSDEGSVTGSTATTDTEGVARPEQWVLGTTAGPHTLGASVPNAPEVPPVGFEAVALPGEPASLEPAEGDGQEVRGGTRVEVTPAVRVLDEFGNAVPGASVTFAPDDFGGLNGDRASVEGSPAEADADGIARPASWTLGIRSGTYTLDATAGGEATATFTATALPTLAGVRDVEASQRHTCALNGAGEAFCWGSNSHGQIGNTAVPLGSAVNAPVLVEGGHLFTAFAGSVFFTTCALNPEGVLFCWGRDPNLTGDLLPAPTSDHVLGGHLFREFELGFDHACGITVSGEALCIGTNDAGQLGNPDAGSFTGYWAPSGGIDFVSVSPAFLTTCGLASDGTVYCWGTDSFGGLGDGEPFGNRVDTPQPVQSARNGSFTGLAGGTEYACARTDAGETHCWGNNSGAQTGIGEDPAERSAVAQPEPVAGSTPFFELALATENSILLHACGMDSDGTLHCWGMNDVGQLGAASTDVCELSGTPFDCAWEPIPVAGGLTALDVTLGLGHTCAVTPADEILCWGGNSSGQLGDGSTTDSPDPVTVLQPREVAEAVLTGLRAPARVEAEVRIDRVDPGLLRH